MMKTWIDCRFGTWRGLLRVLLAYAELFSGRLYRFRLQRPDSVKRVVYVCLGNICRSAYGDAIARELDLPVASLGLSTNTGAASPPEAVDAARRAGVELVDHRALDWIDFEVRSGDLFLVMEVRQAHELRKRLGARTDVQVCLLGMWCSPPMPHLHDPFSLSPAYFDTCFRRVRDAALHLNERLRASAKHDVGTAATVDFE